MLAEKAVWAWEGRSSPRARLQLERAVTEGWVDDDSSTGVDSTGVAGKVRKEQALQVPLLVQASN